MIKDPLITSFQIIGLFGDRDITLTLEHPVKILIDPNGAGKTTVLNILFYILSGNWRRISNIQFDSINLKFHDHENIEILSSDLHNDEILRGTLINELQSRIPISDIRRIVEAYEFGDKNRFNSYVQHYSENYHINSSFLMDAVREYFRVNIDTRHRTGHSTMSRISPKIENISKTIKQLFPYPILYFPTYRRIEEDLNTLGYVEKEIGQDERLIRFGMEDVDARFRAITSEIRDSSILGYAKISGLMITQLIDGIDTSSIDYASIQNLDTFKIVLDRSGPNISDKHKQHVIDLIKSSDIKNEKYNALAYFLSNLIKIYDSQRSNDDLIKKFAMTCNKYLDDKEILYNESLVNIRVSMKRTKKEVKLESLSSGEKQVISIFSRLFLEKTQEYVILFDEPELSLSMEWQKKLLQDIVDSGHCRFLLASTHSPFIFENSLDRFASTMRVRYK